MELLAVSGRMTWVGCGVSLILLAVVKERGRGGSLLQELDLFLKRV